MILSKGIESNLLSEGDTRVSFGITKFTGPKISSGNVPSTTKHRYKKGDRVFINCVIARNVYGIFDRYLRNGAYSASVIIDGHKTGTALKFDEFVPAAFRPDTYTDSTPTKKDFKAGDKVKFTYGADLVEGVIISFYGPSGSVHETANVRFQLGNETKYTSRYLDYLTLIE